MRRRRPLAQRLLTYWAVITLGPLLIGGSLSITSYLVGARSATCSSTRSRSTRWACCRSCSPAARWRCSTSSCRTATSSWRHGLVGRAPRRHRVRARQARLRLLHRQLPDLRVHLRHVRHASSIFLVWLYVSWLVVLVGATLTAMLPAGATSAAEMNRAPGRELAEALDVLGVLARAQAEGRVMPIQRLAKRGRHAALPRGDDPRARARRLGWVAKAEKDELAAGARRRLAQGRRRLPRLRLRCRERRREPTPTSSFRCSSSHRRRRHERHPARRAADRGARRSRAPPRRARWSSSSATRCASTRSASSSPAPTATSS